MVMTSGPEHGNVACEDGGEVDEGADADVEPVTELKILVKKI